MESKQEDITQPLGKQPSQEESRQFTTVANVEGQVGESGFKFVNVILGQFKI